MPDAMTMWREAFQLGHRVVRVTVDPDHGSVGDEVGASSATPPPREDPDECVRVWREAIYRGRYCTELRRNEERPTHPVSRADAKLDE